MATAFPVYATRADWLALLGEYEQVEQVRYTPEDALPTSDIAVYDTVAEIPGLGTVEEPESVSGPAYLIVEADAEIVQEAIPTPSGKTFHHVDADNNPDSVQFSPGGMFKGRCLIAGNIASASRSKASRRLFRSLVRIVRVRCRAVSDSYVAPQAYAYWSGGGRLTLYADPKLNGDLERV